MVMYPFTARTPGDQANSWEQPGLSDGGDLVLEGDERVVGRLTGRRVTINTIRGDIEAVVLHLDDPVEIAITQYRLFYRCANNSGSSRSATSSPATMTVGHFRYPWVAAIGGSAKRGRRDSDVLELRGRLRYETGDEIVTARFGLDTGADPHEIAADIARRAARLRLAEPDLEPAEEHRLRELAATGPLRGAKGQLVQHEFPTFYPLGGGAAMFGVAGSGVGFDRCEVTPESRRTIEESPTPPSIRVDGRVPDLTQAPEPTTPGAERCPATPLDWPRYGTSFPGAVGRGLRKFAAFTGRAGRGEFWWWLLFVIALWIAAVTVLILTRPWADGPSYAVAIAAIVLFLGTLLPTLAVAVRRLHDTGRPGWLVLLGLVPLIGSIVVLALAAGSTAPAAVRYGPPPETASAPGSSGIARRLNSPIAAVLVLALIVVAAGAAAVLRSRVVASTTFAPPELSGGSAPLDQPTVGELPDPSDPGADPDPPSASLSTRPSGQPSSQPSTVPSLLPQAAQPLGQNVLVTRRNDGGEWRIETIATNGHRGAVLVTGRENRAAVLTPDRRTVLYLQELSDRVTLRAVSADGYDDQPLFSDGTTTCPRLGQPAITRNAQLVVSCLEGPGRTGVLAVLGLDGRLIRILDRGRLGDPTFTRDGSTVVYWRSTDATIEGGSLYRTSIDGSGQPSLIATGADGEFDDPVCSPTADRIALTRKQGGSSRIVTLDLTRGAQPKSVSSSTDASKGPSWSPDGTELAFRDGTDQSARIVISDASGAGARTMFSNDGYLAAPLWTAH